MFVLTATSTVFVQIKVLSYLVGKRHVSPSNVMVLSPYLAQCKLIKKMLKKYEEDFSIDINCHVGSVVTSQGGFTVLYLFI